MAFFDEMDKGADGERQEDGGMTTIPEPPVLSPREIDACVAQLRVWGEFYLGQLGGPPITVLEWSRRERERWEQR